MKFAKIGSVLYNLWGILHLLAAYQEFLLGASLDPGPVKGKINQGAWDLLFIASASIVIAVIYNWKNEALRREAVGEDVLPVLYQGGPGIIT